MSEKYCFINQFEVNQLGNGERTPVHVIDKATEIESVKYLNADYDFSNHKINKTYGVKDCNEIFVAGFIVDKNLDVLKEKLAI